MRILITTQKVDREDPVLGFFHGWLHEFSKHCERVTVISLGVGTYSLPENVEVHSLGKEKTADSRRFGHRFTQMQYTLNFYRYIFAKRHEYDAVFVHMNPEYVVLGSIFWRLWGKRIALWYNHKKGGILARIAALFSHIVFHVSPFAFMARFRKAQKMGAGIDTSFFKRDEKIPREKNSILSLGRISPVKNVDVIIQALEVLAADGTAFHVSIYGDPTEKDKRYYDKMRAFASDLEEKSLVLFHGGVANYKTPQIYNEHEIFVNMTPSGSFDKTILEAMACEMIVLTCNESFTNVFPGEYMIEEGNSTDLAQKLKGVLSLDENTKQKMKKELRETAIKGHDISKVVRNVIKVMQTK